MHVVPRVTPVVIFTEAELTENRVCACKEVHFGVLTLRYFVNRQKGPRGMGSGVMRENSVKE